MSIFLNRSLLRATLPQPRTFLHSDGSTGVYDYTSENYKQRRRVEDVALLSHVTAQSKELVRFLAGDSDNRAPWRHMIYTAIYDDTNVWAAWRATSSTCSQSSAVLTCNLHLFPHDLNPGFMIHIHVKLKDNTEISHMIRSRLMRRFRQLAFVGTQR